MYTKKISITMIACAMFAVIVACSAPATSSSTTSSQTLPLEISVQDAAKLRDEGAFILDVREPSEWNEFHIPDATLIPLGQLKASGSQVPKNKPIVVVCRSGNRSATGRNILKDLGFTNVTSMKGGMIDWRNAGLPTVSGP